MAVSKTHFFQRVFNVVTLMQKGVVRPIWSIKVFRSANMAGNANYEMNLDTPTLQASDVKDVQAEFVADPFIIEHNRQFYMFFEVFNKRPGRGEIGFATSLDGTNWDYGSVVLRERFHLSYPQVFQEGDRMYMLPETAETGKVLLYEAVHFPHQWKVASQLFEGRYLDPSIVKYEGKWWIFAGNDRRDLHLFYADTLEGPWTEHAASPMPFDEHSVSRPGGRIIVWEGKIYRYIQEDLPYYGKAVRMFKVNKLTETEYEDEEVSLILSGTHVESDWRKDGMHHIDQLQIENSHWLIAVDGHRFQKKNYFFWRLGRMKARLFS